MVSAPNADGGDTDAGAVYTVVDGALSTAILGSAASGANSAYNGTVAEADGRLVAGFPSASGDSGTVLLVDLEGTVDSLAVEGHGGLRLGKTLAAMDLDGDGDEELLLADDAGLHVVDPAGFSGTVTLATIATASLALTDITAIVPSGDIDGDGGDDVVVINGGNAQVLAAEDVAAGTLDPRAEVTASAAATGDLDGDGVTDLVWVDAGQVRVAYGPVDAAITGIATLEGSFVSLADLDEDGALDLVTAEGSALSVVWGLP